MLPKTLKIACYVLWKMKIHKEKSSNFHEKLWEASREIVRNGYIEREREEHEERGKWGGGERVLVAAFIWVSFLVNRYM